jgi:glutathione S-transferase
MTIRQPLILKGMPGSPYTRKMLAYMRFRHLQYQLFIGNQSNQHNLPEAKVNLLPTFYLPDSEGQIEAVVDSTPLIRRFEAAFDGRQTIPDNPVMGFLNFLVEDYADEWLTKAMFHYRWYYEADIEMAGKILPRWSNIQAPEAELNKLSHWVSERQIARLYVVGSNDTTAPVIEASYKRFLKVMDELIQKQKFVFGHRPSSADFGIYAQLTQLAKFDPTPSATCLAEAPRVLAWTDLVDDLSGNSAESDDWLTVENYDAGLQGLLKEIGRTYAPFLLANAAALDSGAQQVETTIDGQPWVQPVFAYQAKCLMEIRAAFDNLDDSSQAATLEILADTGCESLLTRQTSS